MVAKDRGVSKSQIYQQVKKNKGRIYLVYVFLFYINKTNQPYE